jgi:hypothetical protein
VVFVGDAAMAPYELLDPNGAIYINQNYSLPSIEYLKIIAKTFRHSVWLNPVEKDGWHYTWTTENIRNVFSMFELTLDGLEKAVQYLIKRN